MFPCRVSQFHPKAELRPTTSASFLQTLLPLLLCSLSFLGFLFPTVIATWTSSSVSADDIWIPTHDASLYELSHSKTESTDDSFQHLKTYAVTKSEAEHGVTVELDSRKRALCLEIVESLAVVGELALCGVALRFHAWRPRIPAMAMMLQWVYVFFLLIVSIISATQASLHRRLKKHRTFIYGMSWIISALLVRSFITQERPQRQLALQTMDLCFASLLLLLSIFSDNKRDEVHLQKGSSSNEPSASLFSLATFTWVDPIVLQGYRKTYEIADVWELPTHDKAALVLARSRQLQRYSKFTVHLMALHGPDLFLQGLWAACSAIFTFAPTLLLKLLLQYLEDQSTSSARATWLYVVLIFVSGLLKAVTDGQASWLGTKIAIHLRAIVVGEIFAKSLRRHATTDSSQADPLEKQKDKSAESNVKTSESIVEKEKEKKFASVGNITNLMAVDSVKIANITSYIHLLWASVPTELIIGIALLYNILGYASIAGLAIMIILIPIKAVVARGFSKVQRKIMSATDARILTTSELLQSIRIIKYFVYEDRISCDVQEKRSVELKALRHRFILWTLAVTLYNTTPVLITFFSFLIYTIVDHRTLKPSVAFPALSLFALLRIPLDRLADTLANVQEALVSARRVEAYLSEGETDKYKQYHIAKTNGTSDLIGFQDADITWATGDKQAFAMTAINLNFASNALNAIVGPTGSGKTTLILALIAELNVVRGHINYPGNVGPDLSKLNARESRKSVAYCSQRAWLINDSIRQNILFGSDWDGERYSAVLTACALHTDLRILPAGDETLVGEKGIKLSGGQKQRISLARAVYSKAQHVLLDDCLSAVDSHTGQWIMDHCIAGDLMRNRTCIFVTHNVAMSMLHAKHITVLSQGKVTRQGTPDAVASMGVFPSQEASTSDPNEDSKSTQGSQQLSTSTGGSPSSSMITRTATQIDDDQLIETENPQEAQELEPLSKIIPLAEPERKVTGAIKWSNFKLYFSASGKWFYWLSMVLMFFVNQFSALSIDLWIRQWANASHEKESLDEGQLIQNQQSSDNRLLVSSFEGLGAHSLLLKTYWPSLATPNGKVNPGYYLIIYALLAVAFMMIKAMRMGLLFYGSLTASQSLHNQLLGSITRATFQFYDATPFGQMINRFSRDTEVVDQELAPVLLGFQHAAFSALTIWIVISVITPLFILPSILVVFLYFVIGKLYINSSRDLKRIESLQRSPLYQQLEEILAGNVTIRAYGHERRFFQEALARLDAHSRAFLYLWATNAWFAFRVDLTSALISFLAAAFIVASAGKINVGAAGLSLTFALTFTEHIMWLIRLYAVNEQNMNSYVTILHVVFTVADNFKRGKNQRVH